MAMFVTNYLNSDFSHEISSGNLLKKKVHSLAVASPLKFKCFLCSCLGYGNVDGLSLKQCSRDIMLASQTYHTQLIACRIHKYAVISHFLYIDRMAGRNHIPTNGHILTVRVQFKDVVCTDSEMHLPFNSVIHKYWKSMFAIKFQRNKHCWWKLFILFYSKYIKTMKKSQYVTSYMQIYLIANFQKLKSI